MTEIGAKSIAGLRVSRPQEKFEVTGRALQLYRRWVGRTSLSISEDEPELSSSIYGQAVADRENRVCVFGTTNCSQIFALTINSDEKIQSSWDSIKRIELFVDKVSDPEQQRIRDLQYEIFDKLPPTATLFNQGSHWSLECEIPLAVLEQLSTDLVSPGVESVAIKIEWPFGFIDSSSGAWGFFQEGQLRGHISTFRWFLLTERSHGAAAESTQKSRTVSCRRRPDHKM
jgi:hypothetical protein